MANPNPAKHKTPKCRYGVDTCDGPDGSSGFICRDCADDAGDPPTTPCYVSDCPACRAPCQRNQGHDGQHDCINCGTRWYSEETADV
jgi:hypothetical protein